MSNCIAVVSTTGFAKDQQLGRDQFHLRPVGLGSIIDPGIDRGPSLSHRSLQRVHGGWNILRRLHGHHLDQGRVRKRQRKQVCTDYEDFLFNLCLAAQTSQTSP